MVSDFSTFKNFGQIGIVVRDMDKAIAGLQALGIGPFGPLVGAQPSVRFEQGGKPADIKLKMSFTKVGPVEIELIQPMGPGIHQDFLNSNGDGIHHIAYFVNDMDAEVEAMRKKGYAVLQRGWRATRGGYAYFDTQKDCGIILEIIQR